MNFHGYLLRQFSSTTVLVLASLLGVVWLNHVLRILELVVNKGASFTNFLMLSFFPLPLWLTIALPMAGFISIIWTIHRFLSDRELIVMQAIGLSPGQFSKMPIFFGAVLSVILTVNSVVVLPYGFSKFKELQTLVRTAIPKLLVQDNVFMDIADDLTLFVGERISDNEVGQVFVQDARNPDRLVTLTSQSGQFSISGNRALFVLRNGQRTELAIDGTSTASLAFVTHTLDISKQTTSETPHDLLDSNEETIFNLLNPPDDIPATYAAERKAMGHYRLVSPFLALCLTILATAIMLHGRILRESLSKRILIVAMAGIVIQTGLILSRSVTASAPFLWPSLYLTIFLPMAAGLYMIWKPTAFTSVWDGLRRNVHVPTTRRD